MDVMILSNFGWTNQANSGKQTQVIKWAWELQYAFQMTTFGHPVKALTFLPGCLETQCVSLNTWLSQKYSGAYRKDSFPLRKSEM